MSGFALEVGLHWGAVALYAVATFVLVHAVLFDRPARVRLGLWIAVAGLLPHSAALLYRWVSAGHGPYMARYEVLSSNAWVAVVVLLWFLWRRPRWAALAMVVLPAAFLMIGLGLFTNLQMRALPPSLRSIWLVFHVLFAKLAAGAWLLSVASAVTFLRKTSGATGRWIDRLPAPGALEAYVVRFIGFGFVAWTVSVVAGAIWANQSWGRYWAWDSIETWSLVTWLCYGTFLHAHRFLKLQARATAWAALGCGLIVVATIFVLPDLLPGLHGAYFQ